MSWFSFKPRPVGLLAGTGDYPLLLAEAARDAKHKIFAIAVNEFTNPRIADLVDDCAFIDMGAMGPLIEILKKNRIQKLILAGGLPKKEIYNPTRNFDSTARSFVSSVKNKGDDHLIRAFGVYLKLKHGIDIVHPGILLKNTMASKGVMTKRRPAKDEWDDLRFGFKVSKQIGKLDVGQTVVVKRGVILAVEALEGTDRAIRRGTELGMGQAVVVKTCKPNQDRRFDLPCIGFETLVSLQAGQSSVIGVEAKKTIMLYKQSLIEKANQLNIAIVGL